MVVQTSELNKIYALYGEKNYSEAFEKVQGILVSEPNNPYAKRYEQLLKPYLNDKTQVGKIQTIKGKKLKCSHCNAAISISALTSEQREKIKNNDYSNLTIKCPYCHTQFTLQKKSSNSIIGIKIGDSITYEGKKYTATGSVEYIGDWKEGGYSGFLNYLEWVLLGEDNSYLYFSEGYFEDDGNKKYEYEFSHKITPDFSLKNDGTKLEIAGKTVYFSEKNYVSAKKLYGENSKVFSVGEKVELGEFSYEGKDYALEIESAGRQSEAGIYKTKSVTKRKACEIFGKEYKVAFEGINFPNGKILEAIFPIGIFGSIIIIGETGNYFWLIWIFGTMFIVIIMIFIFFMLGKSKAIGIPIVLLLVGPLFGLLFVPFVMNLFIEKEQKILLSDIDIGKKYELKFTNPELQKQEVTRRTRYDYGGIKTTYKKRKGLQFSVQDEKDKAVIKALQNMPNSTTELRKIFTEPIYKLK